MRIRQKYYPYPVMERAGHSYKDFTFIVNTTVKREGYNVVFSFESNINDKQISELISQGKAVFAYHVQCAQTCCRVAFETKEKLFTKSIKEEDLNGQVEVCPFIIVKEDIKSFSSDNFSSDYMGIRFDIDKGGFLAIGDQSIHTISKDPNDLNNSSSIFRVIANPNPNAENMSVDIRPDKISVVLPKEQHGIYRGLSKNLTLQPAMHAMIFVPALMVVLNELKKRIESSGDFADFSDYRWTSALENVAIKRFEKTLEELIKNREPYELAQMMLKNPANSALELYRS